MPAFYSSNSSITDETFSVVRIAYARNIDGDVEIALYFGSCRASKLCGRNIDYVSVQF
jgi:hypothetical protein